MNIVIGLMPALFWGILPIWMQGKTGGNWTEQLLGTSVGGVISAIVLQLIFHYDYSLTDFLLYFVSGVCWSIGQGGQCWGYGALGVNNAVPFSTALQIYRELPDWGLGLRRMGRMARQRAGCDCSPDHSGRGLDDLRRRSQTNSGARSLGPAQHHLWVHLRRGGGDLPDVVESKWAGQRLRPDPTKRGGCHVAGCDRFEGSQSETIGT